ELCGQAAFAERTRVRGFLRDHDEQRRVWHDVMTLDMIRQLPTRHALVIRGSHTPVIARLSAAWKDPAYRRARRRGVAVARLTPAATASAVGPAATLPITPSASRRLRPVPDLDVEAAGEARGDDSPAFPWS